MNIALCTDDNYIIPCLVTIASVFENNKTEVCDAYILTDSLTGENQKKINSLASKYKQNIYVTKVDMDTYSNLKVIDPFPKSMYYRFLLPSILKNVSKILYLDCDIIVRHSLKIMFEYDLSKYSCAVIEDAKSDNVLHKNKIRYAGDYFNSGVLMMNLDYWREHNISDILVKFIEEYPERCIYPDQDALNINLSNSVLFLPYTYNMQNAFIRKLDKIPFLFTKHEAVKEACKDPIVIHFTSVDKPWFVECEHPYKKEWLHYAKCIDGTDYELKHRLALLFRVKICLLRIAKKIIYSIFM